MPKGYVPHSVVLFTPLLTRPSWPKYSPQHTILRHPQPTSILQCQRPSFTPIQINRKCVCVYVCVCVCVCVYSVVSYCPVGNPVELVEAPNLYLEWHNRTRHLLHVTHQSAVPVALLAWSVTISQAKNWQMTCIYHSRIIETHSPAANQEIPPHFMVPTLPLRATHPAATSPYLQPHPPCTKFPTIFI